MLMALDIHVDKVADHIWRKYNASYRRGWHRGACRGSQGYEEYFSIGSLGDALATVSCCSCSVACIYIV
jgi:hypothetical protein